MPPVLIEAFSLGHGPNRRQSPTNHTESDLGFYMCVFVKVQTLYSSHLFFYAEEPQVGTLIYLNYKSTVNIEKNKIKFI